MLILMQRIAQEYSLGLLCVDEVQHLSLAKGGSDAMLNFFCTLVNVIGLPVVLIGTSKALPILQGEFRQARRSSGYGDLIWNRMKKERTWTMFVRSIWKYQWIRNKVDLTAEMLDAVYEETQGIIVLAVILYVLLQEDAILSGKETFDVADIRRVARKKMGLVQPMIDALRRNDKKLIDQYEDITDILLEQVGESLWEGRAPGSGKRTASSKALDKLIDAILPFFTALKVPPEKTEHYIEQVYRETGSEDIRTVMDKVYRLVSKEDDRAGKEGLPGQDEIDEKPKAGYENLEKEGLLDGSEW